MNDNIFNALDIGSKNFKFISILFDKERKNTKILYKAFYPSAGVSYGYISNPELFQKSFKNALKKFQKESGAQIKDLILTINSFGLKTKKLKISHKSMNQSTITSDDIFEVQRKILSHAKKNIDGEIMSFRVIKYLINGYEYYSDIEGLDAKQFEAEYIFIYLPKNHLNNLSNVFEKEDIFIQEPIFCGNIVSSEINAEAEDRNLGFMNIDFGAKITSVSIWENNKLIFLDHFKYGSDNITAKISKKEKISFNDAEMMKFDFEKNKKVKKIVEDELKLWAKKIKEILIENNKDNLLPSGVILYGGGSKIDLIEGILKNELEMPIKKYHKNISDLNTEYYNVYAAVISFIKKNNKSFKLSFVRDFVKNTFKKIKF